MDENLSKILEGFDTSRQEREDGEQKRLEYDRRRHEMFLAQRPVCNYEVEDTLDQFRAWSDSLAAWQQLAVAVGKSGNLGREISHFSSYETPECAATAVVLANAGDSEKVLQILDHIRQQCPGDAQKVRGCVAGAIVRVGNDFESLVWPPEPIPPKPAEANNSAFDSTEQLVLECLRQSSPALVSQADIVVGVDRADRTVRKAVQSLEARGLVERPRGPRRGYALTEAGRKSAHNLRAGCAG